jgi:uncharacterized protein (DUF169 family)
MNREAIAQGITSGLRLTSPPIALSFVAEPVAGLPEPAGEFPSACSFWIEAEKGVFYAPAERHFNCPVGALVMGFDLPPAVQEQLGGLVNDMCGCGYLGADEAGAIPSVKNEKSGIVYGPLRDFPLDPDLILLWLTPSQAMIFAEAAGTSRWTEAVPTVASGRPACAALPLALEHGKPLLSLGCMGMRTFTQVSQDRLLAVLPGSAAEGLLDRLQSTLTANAAMQTFYEGHRANFV